MRKDIPFTQNGKRKFSIKVEKVRRRAVESWEGISSSDDTVNNDQTQINLWQSGNSPSDFTACCALLQSDLSYPMCSPCIGCNHMNKVPAELPSHGSLSPSPSTQSKPLSLSQYPERTTLAGPAAVHILDLALGFTPKVGQVKPKPRTCV